MSLDTELVVPSDYCNQRPGLCLGYRTTLFDTHHVAILTAVFCVMDVQFCRTTYVFPVHGMLYLAFNQHSSGLVHFAADYLAGKCAFYSRLVIHDALLIFDFSVSTVCILAISLRTFFI